MLTFVAHATNNAHAIALMDKDVAKWMADDIAIDELAQTEDEYSSHARVERSAELIRDLSHAELKARWMELGNRWEMEPGTGVRHYRSFSEKFGDGGFATTVYHLMTENHRNPELVGWR
jgi:hypothetical protein